MTGCPCAPQPEATSKTTARIRRRRRAITPPRYAGTPVVAARLRFPMPRYSSAATAFGVVGFAHYAGWETNAGTHWLAGSAQANHYLYAG